jgi:hypothetical protein
LIFILKDYLKQVDDERWVIHECQQRIPPSYNQNLILLNCGLKLTDKDIKASKIDLDDVGEQEVCLNRLLFLRYLDLLETYNQIYGGKNTKKNAIQSF